MFGAAPKSPKGDLGSIPKSEKENHNQV